MNKYLVFTRKRSPDSRIKKFVDAYKLRCLYKDKKESIFENDIMLLSVTKRVLYILLFDETSIQLKKDVEKFFYGDEYV